MNHLIDFYLIKEVKSKDSTGQSTTQKTFVLRTGRQKSVYQNEFYKAEQAGLRPSGVIVMSSFDYSNEKFLKIGVQEYAIYRVYYDGTDKVELYYGERVGNS